MSKVFITEFDLSSVYGVGINAFEEALYLSKSGIHSTQNFGFAKDVPIRSIGLLPNFNQSYDSPMGRLIYSMDELGQRTQIKNISVDGVIIGKGSPEFSLKQFKEVSIAASSNQRHDKIVSDIDVMKNFLSEINIQYPNDQIFFNSNTCATGLVSLGMAYDRIKHGFWKCALVITYDLLGFKNQILSLSSLRALSMRTTDPTLSSCPFSLERDGMVKSEGINIFLLEAESEKIKIGYGEIAGWACTNDAYLPTDINPDLLSMTNCIESALKNSKISASEITHINTHGSSTKQNDLQESKSLLKVFGENLMKIPASALKWQMGHSTFASGGFSVISSLLMFKKNVIFPTRIITPDPECKLNFLNTTTVNTSNRYSLINAFGFGGHNACMVLKNTTDN